MMDGKRILTPSRPGVVSRRSFLRGASLGAAGLGAVAGAPAIARAARAEEGVGRSRVSFVPGHDRRGMVIEAMKPFEDEIRKGLRGKRVVIKPNFVVNDIPLCATHPDAIRGVLDFLEPHYDGKIIIGEATLSKSGTGEGFRNYNYLSLPDEYPNVELVDYADTPATKRWIMDENGHPLGVDIYDVYTAPDTYFISVTRLKTHDTVVATMSIKNMVMGAPYCNPAGSGNQKPLMHSGQPTGLNYNMFVIAKDIRADFNVLDGVEGMQGNGPVRGFAMDHGVALAGVDAVAVDRVGLELMGIPYEDVAYIQWCARAGMGQGDRSMIDIDGPDPKGYVKKYQLHDKIDWQLGWKNTG